MMKSKLIKISRLFFFFSVILLSSCDFTTLLEPSYDEPVREFFKEYTENAAIEKVTLPAGLKNSSGIICVSSENDSLVSFYMRNPQKYTLSFDFDFNEDDVQVEAASTGFSFTQSDDKNGGTLTFNKDFLYSVDAGNLGGKNISGSISLTEPKSGRSFSSYPISLHANTEPPVIQGAVFQRSSQSDDAKYIVCFFMPNMNDSSMALHTKDTHVIYVNDEKKYTKEGLIYSSGQKNESGDWEISDQATAFTTTKPEFYALTDDESAFTFAPANCPVGYKTLYYITGWPVTTDTKTCTFTIEDDDGLKNTFVISNKASQLNPPTFSVESNTSYSADEETFLYTVKVNHDGLCTDGTTSGSVTINYTVTETNGSLVFAGGTSATLTGSAEGSASLSLPKGEYEIRATASKNYYISSEQSSVSGIKIKKPAIYYISESGVDSDSASGAKGEPYRTIQYALNVFRSGIDSGDYDSDGICNIYVMTDLTPPEDFDFSSNNNSFVEITSALSGATVNITGYGGSRTISAKNNGTAIRSLLKVAAGTVTVDEINFTGGYTNSPDKPIIALAGSATVSISNSKIYGNTLASDTDNVLSLIQSGGSLKMKNVVMSDNFQDVVSGVDPQHAPSFLAIHQTGGNVTLDDCSITSSGTGHGTYWTLISSSGGTLTMNGGSIKDNTSCSAVFENGADMTINNAVINNNGDEWGSIIFNYGTLTVNGGSITNNTGGYNGLITNSDTGNATFTGTVIKNNTLAENAGAGSGDDYYNCGAAFWNKGSLTLDGCTVSGNTINSVNGRGAGIYMQTETGLTLKGKNYIYDNYNKGFATPKRDDIYLPTGGTITVEGNISGSKIGVNVPWESSDSGAPRIGVPAAFTSGYGYGTTNASLPGEIFIAENGYGVSTDSSGEAAFAVSGGGMYTALDYTVNLTASSVSVYPDTEKNINIAVSGSRKESGGTPTQLYYNNEDNKFYIDEAYTTKAADNNTVTFAAVLYNGATKVSDCTVNSASETGKIAVTIPKISYEETYTLRITSTFLGVTKDTSVEYAVKKIVSVASLSEAPTSGTYSLSTLSELEKIKDWVSSNNTLQNVTFTLEDDIDTNGEELIIGYYKYNDSANRAFMGVFDGNNHSITNNISASSVNTDARIALFPYVKGSSTVIKNLTVKGTSTRGSIVGYLDEYATVENCISETTIDTSVKYIGGVVCDLEKGYIKNCINKGAITSTSSSTGGILGYTNSGSGAIDRCINKGEIAGTAGFKGGIVGYMQSAIPITNCKNSGNIIGSSNYIGGIFGFIASSSAKLNNNCNLGEVKNGGGIIGSSDARTTTIYNNCNSNTAQYGIIKYFDTYIEALAANNNYSLNVYTTALYPSTASGSFNPSTITELQIKSFELSEAGSVVESLNNWATTNSTTSLTYASWKLNAEGKPELDLGEMDTW